MGYLLGPNLQMLTNSRVGGRRELKCWLEWSGRLLPGGGAGLGLAGGGESSAGLGESGRECRVLGQVRAKSGGGNGRGNGEGP